MKRLGSMFIIVLIMLLASCGVQNQAMEANSSKQTAGEQDEHEFGVQKGQRPPPLTLETADGNMFDPSVLEDKKVLIKFWASWCTYCMQEMPDIIQLGKEYDDLVIIAVNAMEDQQTVQHVVEQYDLQFPVLLDRTYALARSYQVYGLPTSYFIHSDGTVAHSHLGSSTYQDMVAGYELLR